MSYIHLPRAVHLSKGVCISDAISLCCTSSSGAKVQDIIDINVLPKAFQQDDFKHFRVANALKYTIDPNTGNGIKGTKKDHPCYTYKELLDFGDIKNAKHLQFVPKNTPFSVLDFDSDKAKSNEHRQMQVDFVRKTILKQFEGIVELSAGGFGLHAYMEDKAVKALGVDIAKSKLSLEKTGLLSFEAFAGKSPIILTGNIVEEAGIDSGMGTLHKKIWESIQKKYSNSSQSPEPSPSNAATASTEKEITIDQSNVPTEEEQKSINERFVKVDKKNRTETGYGDIEKEDTGDTDFAVANLYLIACNGNIDHAGFMLHQWMTKHRPDSGKKLSLRETTHKALSAIKSAYKKTEPDVIEQWEKQAQKEKDGIKPHPFTRASDIKLSAPEWIIRGFMQKRESTQVFGDPASGKSLIILDMAVAVSNGTPWLGNHTKKLTVLYLAGEGSQGIRRRLKAIELNTGANINDILISDRPAMLMSEESTLEVAEAIKGIDGDVWLIADTLHRNFGDGDENAAKDFGKMMSNVDQHIIPLGATFSFVHHSGHGDKTRGRGSSAIHASIDSEFKVEKTEDTIVISCTKMKDAPKPKDARFDLKVVDLGIKDEYGDAVTSVCLEPMIKTELQLQMEEFNLNEKHAIVLQFWRHVEDNDIDVLGGRTPLFLEWLENKGFYHLFDDGDRTGDRTKAIKAQLNYHIKSLREKGLIPLEAPSTGEEEPIGNGK